MPYYYIENFESGLDTRKSVFTAPAGSLRKLVNGHITRGKEIERRKLFANFADLPAGTFGLHSLQGRVIVFGSGAEPAGLPPQVQYQRLQAAGGGDMTKLHTAVNFDGLIYAIAEYDTGAIHHFYDGTLVSDWDDLAGDTLGSELSVNRELARRVSAGEGFRVDTQGASTLYTGEPGVSFSMSVTSNMTYSLIQSAVAAQAEVLATGSFDITGGGPGQTFNTIGAVTVDGADLLGSPVDFVTDNATTAQVVADRVNSYVTAYSASASGATVTIEAPLGTGADANGRDLEVDTNGDVTVGSVQDFSGGADPVPAVPQISKTTVDSYTKTDAYTVTVDSTDYTILGFASAVAKTAVALKGKLYAPTLQFVYFSGYTDNGTLFVPDPTVWIDDGGTTTDFTGFINLADQHETQGDAIGVAVYQDKLAAFTEDSVQLWSVDDDQDLNALYQVLSNIGCSAPGSIVEYGDVDIFFLSESGLRSLRARDSSNLASTNDVGASIDADLGEYRASISGQEVADARAILEPRDSRYLLAIGSRVYVFSNFPGSQVSAWSTYEVDEADDPIEGWVSAKGRLYARSGDEVLLYGGASGEEYSAEYTTEVETPFMDSENPAGLKQAEGMDAGVIGTWGVYLRTEPTNPDEEEQLAVLSGATYGSHQRIGAAGTSTHFGLRLMCDDAGPALLANLIFHYRDIRAD